MRILHAADLHLDSPFASLSDEKAKLRREESRQVLRKLAQLANENDVDIVLLCGDLFDGANVYRETVDELTQMLDAIRCPVFITPGNHDYYRPRSPYTKILFPEHVHLFAAPEIRAVALEKCIVYGAAFWEEQEPEGFLQGFRVFDDERLHIMCIHGDLTGGPYNPITKQQIAQSGLDYLALGHIHAYSGLQREGKTFYAYPGCSEGRGFDETGEKGCLLLDVEKGSVTAEFIPLCTRRYEICSVDVTERDALQVAEEALAGYSDEDVIRLVLVGERQEDLAVSRLEQCGQRFFGFEVVDQTREKEDIWSRAGEDSLRGIFLQNLKERYDAAQTDAERETVLMAAKVGLAALDNREL
jgi:DNA repair exonuclease SbcCD nuclease subunit